MFLSEISCIIRSVFTIISREAGFRRKGGRNEEIWTTGDYGSGYAKTGSVTIVAEESPGGARYSVVLENTAAPVRFDPDTIPIVSFEVDGNDFVLSFLNKANTWYEIQSAPSPEGPWTRKMSKYCRDAPTVVSFIESASTRPRKFFYRVREAPSP